VEYPPQTQWRNYLTTWTMVGLFVVFSLGGFLPIVEVQAKDENVAKSLDNALFLHILSKDNQLSEQQAGLLNNLKSMATTEEINTVQVKFDVLSNVNKINFNVAANKNIYLTTDRIEKRADGNYSWFGTEHATQSSVILVVQNNEMVGTIRSNKHLYQIRPLGGGLHVIILVDESAFPDDHPPGFREMEKSTTKSTIKPPPNKVEPKSKSDVLNDDGSIIKVLVAYTPVAKSQVGNINALIQLAIDETNQSYVNSKVNTHLQLVYSYETNYQESSDISTDLARFKNKGDSYMDEVHSYRDCYVADIAILITGEGQYCGKASDIMADESTAFALVAQNCATGYYSFGHEIGHLQGAEHNPEAPNGSYFAYGHGYYYESDYWRTIMSYNCSAGCTRLPFWSNPNVTNNEIPMGSLFTHHNARVLNETAYTVANFRNSSGNNCWQWKWGNQDNLGQIALWNMNSSDKYLAGDFDNDDQDEVLAIATNGWAHVMEYSNGSWQWRWGNDGVGKIALWNMNSTDRYFAGDFDNDGQDEALAIATNGWTHVMEYNSNSWQWRWGNNGVGKIALWNMKSTDRYFAGDFDNDGQDEVLAIATNGWAHVMEYNGGSWQWQWGNNGVGKIALWNMKSTDRYFAGDFDNDGQDEILAIATNGWAHVMEYNNGSWQWRWGNDGVGKIALWNMNGSDKYIVGDFDNDGQDEVLAIATNGWAHVMEYNDDLWQWLWGNSGIGKIALWNMNSVDRYIASNFDATTVKDELLAIKYPWVHLMTYKSFLCVPPSSSDWIISESCTFKGSATAPANVIVKNGAILTITNGAILNINFVNYHLKVKSGSGVLVKNGGKIH